MSETIRYAPWWDYGMTGQGPMADLVYLVEQHLETYGVPSPGFTDEVLEWVAWKALDI